MITPTRIYRAFLKRLPSKLTSRFQGIIERVRQKCINPIVKRFFYSRYVDIQVQSSAYSRQHPRARVGTERSIGILIEHLSPGSIIFDAGCGDGYALDLLKEKGFRYLGGDINEAKIADAKRHGHLNVRMVDLHKLDIPSQSVDAIHCSHVLEHLLDAPGVIREFKRIVKSGGLAMIVVPIGPSNRAHPTAFLTEFELTSLVVPYFQVITQGRDEARGREELWMLLKSGDSELRLAT